MKVSDLITIPQVETVIQVSSLEGMHEDELKRKIVDSFVITENILKTLEAIFFTIKNKNGCGIIIKGNYGSGKSHLLAFLSAMFRYPSMISNLSKTKPELCSLYDYLKGNKILPLSITLTDYSVENSLAEIVTEKISSTLQKAGITGITWDSTRIISDFNKLILPNIEKKFHDYIKSHDTVDLKSISPSKYSSLIISFLKENSIPFRPFYDYQEIFNNIDDLIKDNFPGGIFLMIDELSEFLRARNRGDSVSEDIRFIQFCGEKVKDTRLGIIFAMQESIEEVADISSDGLNRIKDRYPIKINLTSIHLRELVEKRLLQKKSDVIHFIDDIYLSLVDSFPELKISNDYFRAIYPVHPATFSMLEGITGLFSKTRGMVDFIYTEVKGDVIRGIKGIMNKDASTLLYPDKIFDHFKNSLQESIEYNKIINNIYSTFEREIPDIFPQERDRNLALRLIKLIVLFQILEENKRPTTIELSHLVMEARFKLDPDYNYIFIRKKILGEMERRCRFLGVEKGDKPSNDRFFLLYRENPISIFETNVRQFIGKNVNIEKQALWFFISRLHHQDLPLLDFKDGRVAVTIRFENTFREGLVYLKSISTTDIGADNIDILLGQEEYDFILFIGFPVVEEGVENKLKTLCSGITSHLNNNIFYWAPNTPIDPEFKTLQNSFAKIKVFEQLKDSNNLKSISDITIDAESKAFSIIKNLYGSGVLFSYRDGYIIQNELLFTSSFEKTVELFTRDVLKNTFPSHSRIMPSFEISSTETYKQIIQLFREKGEVDFNFEGSKAIKNVVNTLLKNSALLKITRNLYTIEPDPSKNIFIKDLLYEIEQNPLTFNDLYLFFRKGKYGIQKELFSLYIFCLTYSGFITIEKGGRTLNPKNLDLKIIQSSDRIKTGEEISTLFIEKFLLLGSFTQGLNSKNIHLQTQKKIWNAIIEFKRNEEQNIRDAWSSIIKLEEYPLFRDNPLNKLKNSYERLTSFISNIRVSKQSKEGFDTLLESMGSELFLSDDLEINERFKNFLLDDVDQMIFIYSYITNQNIYFGDNDDLKNDLFAILALLKDIENLIINHKIGNIIERFNNFKDKYKIQYLKAHQKIHNLEIIDEFDRIKLTSAYRILYNLAKIKTISVEDDLIKIDTLIRSVQTSLCRRSVSRELDLKPYCTCSLQKNDINIDISNIQNLIKNGIKQYLNTLKNNFNREKIINFMGALLSTQDDEKGKILKEIIRIDERKASDNDMVRIITPQTIDLINRALSGNIRIIKKKIQDFYNSIYGRRFKKEDLTKIFNNWLETEYDNAKEELILEIVGFDEKNNIALPSMLMEEINRVIKIDDENIKLQAFALVCLLYNVSNGKYLGIIKDVLFVDLHHDEMRGAFDIFNNFLKDNINLEEFFTEDILNDVISSLSINEMIPEEIVSLYESAKGFGTIREIIVNLFIMEEIKITKELQDTMIFDKSPYSNILSSLFEFQIILKKYYRESGKRDSFNTNYFFMTFEALFQLELIQWISLNNNIMIDSISKKTLRLSEEIERGCNDYYNNNIDKWEEDNELNTNSIVNLITHKKPVLFIFDSLRLDLFIKLHNILISNELLIQKTKNLLLSPYPSNTLTFRKNLFPQIEFKNGLVFKTSEREWIIINAAERDYRKEDIWRLFSDNDDIGIILSFSIFDEKIHNTKQSILSLADELVLFVDQIFIPLIRGIPADRKIYITSDHGFIEHKGYGKKDQPRYTHGGNSFFERIIPFAVYEKK